MGFVFSPSNMDAYRKCPRRFEGQSLTGEIKWKASKAKSRGTMVHEAMEKAIRYGMNQMPVVEGMDALFVTQKVDSLRQAQKLGARIMLEHPLCVTKDWKHSSDWWADSNYLRARADAVVLPNDDSIPPMVIDFKTGKKWDDDAFQLRVETLLIHHIYKAPVVGYSYWYVDSGDTCSGIVDFSNGTGDVADILALLATMEEAISINKFASTRNRFCKWCDFHMTPKCTA